MTTNQQIVSDIVAYMGQWGGAARDWYVGIASDARDCLFARHAVVEHGDAWIYRQAGTDRDARSVENYFHQTLGTKGGPGGGDASTRYVYAYRITSRTVE